MLSWGIICLALNSLPSVLLVSSRLVQIATGCKSLLNQPVLDLSEMRGLSCLLASSTFIEKEEQGTGFGQFVYTTRESFQVLQSFVPVLPERMRGKEVWRIM